MKKILSIFLTTTMLVVCLFGCAPVINTDGTSDIFITTTESETEVVISDEVKKLTDDTISEVNSGDNVETDDISEIDASSEDEITLETESAIETDAVIDQEDISWDGTNTGKGTKLLGKCTGKVYFNQADPRWANSLYTSTNNKSQTMKSSGCGPTSAAIIVSSSKGAITPLSMANIFVDNGYRTCDNGTAWSCWSFIADYFNFNHYESTTSFSRVEKLLEIDNNKDGISDYFAVVSVGYGPFTTGGHYITITGDKNDTLEIGDPYYYPNKYNTTSRRAANITVKGHLAYMSESNFKKYANAKQYWIFSNDYTAKKQTTTTKPNNTSSRTKVMYVNTKTTPLNVRKAPNGAIVGSLPRGSKVNVYETKNGWSRIGTDRWVSYSYLSTSKPTSSNTTTKVTYKTTVGKRYRLKHDSTLYSKGNLTGTKYNYLKYTELEVLQHYSTNVDKIKCIKTGRVCYAKVSDYI